MSYSFYESQIEKFLKEHPMDESDKPEVKALYKKLNSLKEEVKKKKEEEFDRNISESQEKFIKSVEVLKKAFENIQQNQATKWAIDILEEVNDIDHVTWRFKPSWIDMKYGEDRKIGTILLHPTLKCMTSFSDIYMMTPKDPKSKTYLFVVDDFMTSEECFIIKKYMKSKKNEGSDAIDLEGKSVPVPYKLSNLDDLGNIHILVERINTLMGDDRTMDEILDPPSKPGFKDGKTLLPNFDWRKNVKYYPPSSEGVGEHKDGSVVTVLCYLGNVKKGGSTCFGHFKPWEKEQSSSDPFLRIKPKTGRAWFSINCEEGVLFTCIENIKNELLHFSEPIGEEDEKYVIQFMNKSPFVRKFSKEKL